VYPADAASLQPALDEVRALERLVEDLRTLSLAETGTLVLARESIDPALLVNDVVTAFQPSAAGAGVSLSALLPAPLDLPAIDVDPVRIRQVLANLVSNALAHTPAGGSIVVSALGSSGGGASPGWVELTVADTGEGMAPELLPRAFDRFVKGEGSRGSGLGLAIARDLVEAHGGTIAAESDGRGLGTRVRVRLPVEVSDRAMAGR
jgi:signal transduction histidine kinase